MPNLLKYPINKTNLKQQYEWVDDFQSNVQPLWWTATVTDTGTVTIGDAVNGVVVLTPSDASVADNDEVYYTTKNELFNFAADKHFLGGAAIKFTETTAGVYNAFVGFGNAMVADTLIDNGGGMRASGSLAAIYKVDGGTVWRATSRNNGVVTDSISSTSSTSTGWQELMVEVIPFSTTQVKVAYFVNGVSLKDATSGLEIFHTVTVASATEMQFGMGAKLGAATNNDTLSCDFAYWAANRV